MNISVWCASGQFQSMKTKSAGLHDAVTVVVVASSRKRRKRMPLKDLLPDIQKIQMGIQSQQLSALLCAILDHYGGSVTLTEAEVERVHTDPHLNFEKHPDGSLTLSLAK